MVKGILLSIVTIGSPNAAVLRQPAEPVSLFGGHTERFFHSMVTTMHKANGIGIAAQQVGETIAMCAVDVSPCVTSNDICILDGKKRKIRAISPVPLFNPEITKFSQETNIQGEGCLSIPGVRKEVERSSSIVVRYQDEKGSQHELECDGIFARCIQHEVDHLNGILFIDKAIGDDAADSAVTAAANPMTLSRQ